MGFRPPEPFVNMVWVALTSHEVVKEYIIGSKH